MFIQPMIVAIVNPNSAHGKAASAWAKARAFLPGGVEELTTRSPGHAIELVRAAINAGAKTIVAVGGDGTINEVVNGFFEDGREISHEVRLGIIPYGTGSDFARTLRLPLDPKRAAAVIHPGEPKWVDILKVAYTRDDGFSALRYSINITSLGMGGIVAARAKRSYLLATLQTALTFRGNSVRLTIDGTRTVEERISNVAVGNGQYHGAGMRLCPGASISDGLLDVTVVRYLSLFELLKGIPTLYNGDILKHPKVKAYRAKHVQAASTETVLIEVDGEPLGRLPIEIWIVPKAIRVLMP
jgi:YegS/Rv2252/BmrU family lipid kinase